MEERSNKNPTLADAKAAKDTSCDVRVNLDKKPYTGTASEYAQRLASHSNAYPQLMFDIETLGRRVGDGILEIGWCTFSHYGVHVTPALEILIPIEQNLLHGFTHEEDTVKWWLETMKGFRKDSRSDKRPHASMPQLLSEVASQWDELWYLGTQDLWCNGLTMDVDMLKFAFDKLKVPRPIILREENFSKWHDYRTLRKLKESVLHGHSFMGRMSSIDSLGYPHRAMADAHVQAFAAAEVFDRFRQIQQDSLDYFHLQNKLKAEAEAALALKEQRAAIRVMKKVAARGVKSKTGR